MLRVRDLFTIALIVGGLVGVAASPVQAKWGPKSNCGIKSEPKNEPRGHQAPTGQGLPSGDVGMLVGQLYVSGKPAAGWYVFAGSKPMPRLAIRRKTARHGVFSFRLKPGRYYVKAIRPNHGFCGATTVTVHRHKDTKVKLSCTR